MGNKTNLERRQNTTHSTFISCKLQKEQIQERYEVFQRKQIITTGWMQNFDDLIFSFYFAISSFEGWRVGAVAKTKLLELWYSM